MLNIPEDVMIENVEGKLTIRNLELDFKEGDIRAKFCYTTRQATRNLVIRGLINNGTGFYRVFITRSEMATEWDRRQLCTIVCAKPEVGISPRSLCGGPWRNVYNSVRHIS